MELFKIIIFWDFPGGSVIKSQTSTAEGTGSLPGSQIPTSMAWPKIEKF